MTTAWDVAVVGAGGKTTTVKALGTELTARGRITRDRRRLFEGTGEIYLPDGTVAVSAAGRYMRLPLESISDIDPESLGWRVYAD